jgi:hypothetical protein
MIEAVANDGRGWWRGDIFFEILLDKAMRTCESITGSMRVVWLGSCRRHDMEKEESGKRAVTLWLDGDVTSKLDDMGAANERSRSWMANLVIRQALGLPQKTPGKEVAK